MPVMCFNLLSHVFDLLRDKDFLILLSQIILLIFETIIVISYFVIFLSQNEIIGLIKDLVKV